MRRSALSDLLLDLDQRAILDSGVQLSQQRTIGRRSVTVHTRALRRLGLIVMALATLGGCVAADYGSSTGGYYSGGYAYSEYIYGYPGNSAGFGGFWVGVEHGHWPRRHGSRGNWHNHRSGWHGTRGNWHGHPVSPKLPFTRDIEA